ncbi:MAG TPA: SIMPL domain-containing protein [Candidatus Dormibacteraeota bacterium]|nr:SIMPL domain-containing protein [Candidatus Dormibacteraeota bacterium]
MQSGIRQTVTTTAIAVTAALVVGLVVVAAGRPVILQTPLTNVATSTSFYNPGVITSGDATVSKRPDVAYISVGVEAQASTASAAQKDLATLANRLIAKAKSLGIPDKEINTGGYSVGPIYSPDGKATITGYQAGETLELTWHNVDNVGSALDGLVQQGGAMRISVSFGLNDTKSAQAEARSLAIADAKNRASAMAKAAGVQLGQVLRITDQTQVSRPPMYSYAAAAAPVDQTQVPVGRLDVTVSVEVDFAIA